MISRAQLLRRYGCSMGGAATLLAAQPLGIDALVLEAVYPRITQAVENRLRLRIGPAATLVAPLLLAQLPLRLHIAAAAEPKALSIVPGAGHQDYLAYDPTAYDPTVMAFLDRYVQGPAAQSRP